MYVGISGRTAVSVLAQYIKTLREQRVLPELLRTDRGGETPLVADAHYDISNKKRSQADGSDLTFSQAFKYGTSKDNSRIESWWEEQSRCSLTRWRAHWHELTEGGLNATSPVNESSPAYDGLTAPVQSQVPVEHLPAHVFDAAFEQLAMQYLSYGGRMLVVLGSADLLPKA